MPAHLLRAWTWMLACGCAAAIAADDPARQPVPSAAAQQQSRQTIRRLFAKDFEAGTPSQREALAKKLMQLAGETLDDPAGRYVLLDEARLMAMSVPDPNLALQAVDRQAANFELDGLEAKVQTLTQLGEQVRYNSQRSECAEAALKLSQQAALAEQPKQAMVLGELALQLATKASDGKLKQTAEERLAELRTLAELLDQVAAARQKLEQSPTDPQANLTLGTYLCLVCGEWNEGLPLLAFGSDPALKSAAQQDLAEPSDADARLAVADAWFELAGTQQQSNRAAWMYYRAGHWYQQAIGDLSGLAAIKARKRLAETRKQTASLPTKNRGIDLLAMVDLEQDQRKGSWTRHGNSFTSEGWNNELVIPYLPPEEYDLYVKYNRLDAGNTAQTAFGLVSGETQFMVFIDQYTPDWKKLWHTGLHRVGTWRKDLHNEQVGQDNTDVKILIQVRRNRVSLEAQGKQLFNWEGDIKQLTLQDPRQPASLFITSNGKKRIDEMRLVPVTGTGKPLR